MITIIAHHLKFEFWRFATITPLRVGNWNLKDPHVCRGGEIDDDQLPIRAVVFKAVVSIFSSSSLKLLLDALRYFDTSSLAFYVCNIYTDTTVWVPRQRVLCPIFESLSFYGYIQLCSKVDSKNVSHAVDDDKSNSVGASSVVLKRITCWLG